MCMPLKFFHNVFDIWKWILVLDSPVIDWSVVLYWAVRPILLFDAKGTGGIWGFRWVNIPFCKLFFSSFMHKLGFWGTEWIDFTLKSVRGVWFEVNNVVILSPWWWEAFCFFFRETFQCCLYSSGRSARGGSLFALCALIAHFCVKWVACTLMTSLSPSSSFLLFQSVLPHMVALIFNRLAASCSSVLFVVEIVKWGPSTFCLAQLICRLNSYNQGNPRMKWSVPIPPT